MSRIQYRLHPDATEDLTQILEYTIDQYNQEQALEYVYGMHAGFERLCESPNIGALVEGQKIIRYMHRGEHVILYHLTTPTLIEILGVFHQSSNWVSHISKV